MEELYNSLHRRKRPEDIAQLIMEELHDQLSIFEKATISKAARGALKSGWGFSSMSEDFARPVGMLKQLTVAKNLFINVEAPSSESSDEPDSMQQYMIRAGNFIHKIFGKSDFKADRLNKIKRKAIGLDISKRQYNKRFRLLARMERKRNKLMREIKKREFTLMSKSRLASKLSKDQFSSDKVSASFIAYYVARCNLRSEFTIWGQQKAYDEIAEMLFNKCLKNTKTNWWAIAHVFPDKETLKHLNDQQKGELLGRWFSALEELSNFLKQIWDASQIDRSTMIVKRGNDSTTWNNTAGAWNKAREAWISVLYAMNMDEVVDQICPGKVLRLMAADVAAWHRSTGGGLDPDTSVWNELPFPWEVLSEEVVCTRSQVESVCKKYGVDPIKKGWTAPRPGKRVAVAFQTTPELVHGITIGHPGLALILRKAGFFSGKIKPSSG